MFISITGWLGFFKASIELTKDDLREIEDAASKIKIEGARYPEAMERTTNR